MTTTKADVELDPVSALLATLTTREVRRFEGRNGRLRNGRAIHAVRPQTWMGGLEVPAPACHVGTGSWRLSDFEPTEEPVTCRRCLSLPAARAAAAPVPETAQLALDLGELPR